MLITFPQRTILIHCIVINAANHLFPSKVTRNTWMHIEGFIPTCVRPVTKVSHALQLIRLIWQLIQDSTTFLVKLVHKHSELIISSRSTKCHVKKHNGPKIKSVGLIVVSPVFDLDLLSCANHRCAATSSYLLHRTSIETTHQSALLLFRAVYTMWEKLNDGKFTDAAANICFFCLFVMTIVLYLTHFGVKVVHQYSWWLHLVIWLWTHC